MGTQSCCGLAFLAAGGSKLAWAPAMVAMFAKIGFGQWFRILTGSLKDVTVRVKFVEQKVRAYRPDELKTIFAAAEPEEWILFQFFLCAGAREQEVMCAEWNDIDFVDGLFTVRAKENWTPKD